MSKDNNQEESPELESNNSVESMGELKKEKREIQASVALALESELEAIVSGSSTSTISTEASNISWIRSGMQKLYLMTTQKPSRSKSRKRKSKTTTKRKRKWR